MAARVSDEKLARLSQRLAVANAKVAQSEAVYARERAASLVGTWKYCTLELPAILMQLKGIEAGRAELLASCHWKALDAMGALPAAHASALEERTRLAAMVKGRQWLDATL